MYQFGSYMFKMSEI